MAQPYIASENVTLIDRIICNTFKAEARYITKCVLHGNDHFTRLFFRRDPTAQHLTPELARPILEEIKAVCADFYMVSGDSEIQMRRIVPGIATLFVVCPSLLVAWMSSARDTDALANLLHMQVYDKHPPYTYFRINMTAGMRRTAWSFAAVVSHGIREQAKLKTTHKQHPLFMRVTHWMEECVQDWHTTIPGILLIHEIIRAVKYSNAHHTH